uniref:TNF receptor superfamily member 25 n=1 Tax=Chelonoidis abingdonii TaxID=106734 RepID=A0A8C0IYZ7_CHEAB
MLQRETQEVKPCELLALNKSAPRERRLPKVLTDLVGSSSRASPGNSVTGPHSEKEAAPFSSPPHRGLLRKPVLCSASQLVLKNCTETSDIECGCGASHFRQCTDPACRDFTCQECRRCKGRGTRHNCECPERCPLPSKPGTAPCLPCCPPRCPHPAAPHAAPQLLASHFPRCPTDPTPPPHPTVLPPLCALCHGTYGHPGCLPPSPPPTLGTGAGTGTSDSWQLSTGTSSAPPSLQAALLLADTLFRCPAGPLPGVLPQGSKLYDIINTVPVRRWKEFMRVLELHDGEIEVVELEFAHVRDQQYEMLKRWYQQKNATLESIFSALERMELAGCAEELRQRLQRCP